MFKLALIQMRVAAGQKEENLRHAENLIAKAASSGAQLIVLPEAMTLGWTDPSAKSAADEIPNGESCRRLQSAARAHQVYLCSGIIERCGAGFFNAALLIDPEGEILLHHRKLNELEIGHHLYGVGDRLQVAHTPLGRIGLMICADGFARGQVITRTLGYMGADIIISPSAWAVVAEHDDTKTPYGKIWLDNYQPVARDFRIWIAGVSNVGWIPEGPWKGRKCIGCSLVINPAGETALRGPYGPDAEAILYLDITLEPRPAQGCGWERLWTENAAAKSA
jgi:predicted amidohydrolase